MPTRSPFRSPLLRPLLRLPVKKIGIWAGFLFLLYELRDFFGLIFLTFVLSYITSTIVNRIQGRFSSRLLPVVLVYAAIVGSFVALGWATIPGALSDGRGRAVECLVLFAFAVELVEGVGLNARTRALLR